VPDYFDKDGRIEIIKGLILEEEMVGEPVIYKITVLQSIIEYEKCEIEDVEKFRDVIIEELKKIRPFSPRRKTRPRSLPIKSQLNEGFLQFSKENNEIECYYVREMPFRWEFVDAKTRSIQHLTVKRVDPSYRVIINISFEEKRVIITLFGGNDVLVFRARKLICETIKRFVYNFSTKNIYFPPRTMRNILKRFGRHVELLNIDPRDNEKFTKIVKQKVKGKAEVKDVIIYDVSNVRMTGIRITISPEVMRLLEEEGIRITEIRGGLWLEMGIRITTRVKANGRVEFIIPSKYFGNDLEKIYEAAVKLYYMLVSEIKPPSGPLERYLY